MKKNEFFGLDEEIENKQEEIVKADEEKKTDKKRKPFAYWNVGDKEYKLKLTTAQTCKLEEKYRCNLMALLIPNGASLPPLGIMLTVIQAAADPWTHGLKYKDLQTAFDRYVEDGGTQLTLFSDVIMQIMMVSGFFTETQQEEMEDKIEDLKETM